MKLQLTNCKMYKDGKIVAAPAMMDVLANGDAVSFSNCLILPTFCDVHVHFREPGFLYKETTKTGSQAAARGGYTDVCTMPNLNPVPDCLAKLQPQLDAIKKDAVIRVHPFGSLTVDEKGEQLAAFEEMAPYVIGYSDDGRGVQDKGMMREAMQRVKALGKVLAAHCEDNALLNGGYIHLGDYAAAHGHKGICSESEWKPIARDVELLAQTGCKYHVCHVSTKESVEVIRQAKKSGIDITCETGPHYLTLDDSCLQEDGRFKMNPPLRSPKDREALIEGVLDGTIDMIATDHAPHSAEEKAKGLANSMMGVVGLETAFPVLYTELVKKGVITLEKLIEMMAIAPRKRFSMADTNDFCVYDLNSVYAVDPAQFATKGRSTPFAGDIVYGENLLTVCDGKVVFNVTGSSPVIQE